jgi:hypothetical protein
MAEPPPYPDPGDDIPDGEPVSTRRWASVLGVIIAILVVLLLVVLHLTGALGPGAH